MKKILLLLAAAAMLLVGCSKEKNDEAIDNGGYSYSVSIGDWTRVVLLSSQSRSLFWGGYKMLVGDIRQVSVTPEGSSPEPESISVSLSNDCLSWDSEKKTVKAEKTGVGVITVKFKVLNSEKSVNFSVSISNQ